MSHPPASNSSSSQRRNCSSPLTAHQFTSLYSTQLNSLRSKSHCDWRSVSQSVSKSLMTRYLLLFGSYGLVFVERPLWRDDGSVFCICCWPCQRSISWVRVLWYSGAYFTVSDFRLPFSSPPTTRRVTPPPHGFSLLAPLIILLLTSRHGPHRKYRFPASPLTYDKNLLCSSERCLENHYIAITILFCSNRYRRHMSLLNWTHREKHLSFGTGSD
jgi:hypothetical protein